MNKQNSNGRGGSVTPPTFGVVSMMREDPSIIRRFIDFYASAGAETIDIFHDGPIADRSGLAGSGVTVTECDAIFWQDLIGEPKPKVHEEAQAAIYNAAWKACRSDWLLVVDADEFVTGPRPIRFLLQAIPPEVDAIRIPTAEAVWGPGDDLDKEFGCTHFRTPISRGSRLIQRFVYGDLAPLFHMGLLGHTAGKHFVRRAARIDTIRLHNSLKDGQPVGQWAATVAPEGKGFILAHFDAISFDRWREKWRRRVDGEVQVSKLSSQRGAQENRIRRSLLEGGDAGKKLFARLNGLKKWQYFILRQAGAAARVKVVDDPSPPPCPRVQTPDHRTSSR